MSRTPIFATAVAATSILALTSLACAGEQLSFPSPNGPVISASTPAAFVSTPGLSDAQPNLAFLSPHSDYSKSADFTPIALAPAGAAFQADRFGARTNNADAGGFRFITHALGYSAFANYANDYYRLFASGRAVETWTDRVAGFVDAGYGGPIEGWTAATYYMPARRGPRRDTAPDLSLMPTLRAHPELQQSPTFTTK